VTDASDDLRQRMFERNRGTIFCFRMYFWRRNYVRAYLRSPGNRIVFVNTAKRAEELGFNHNAHALVWGMRDNEEIRAVCERHSVPLWRMEDGFLRSIGLGSNMETPASLVVDREGIYYDPARASELETILENLEAAPAELERAKALREGIVSAKLSKYNVGGEHVVPVDEDKRVVLVPGQVADDASVKLGCRDVATNLALLQHARAANPDAYIIYKPHPDVLSGNRDGGTGMSEARNLCDHIEERASLAQCLAVADEVHTLTSLVGFESLLRGLEVVVYGQPFYAGWGLTRDRHPVARRTRRLTLDELVLGVLIRYPRYVIDGQFTSPEGVVRELERRRDTESSSRIIKMSWPRRQLRRLRHIVKEVTSAP